MTSFATLTRLSRPRQIMIAALLIAAAGIIIQIVAGVHYGTVPPGLVIILVAAVLAAFVRWRWTPAPIVAVAAFVFLGGFTSTNGKHSLDHPGQTGAFVGIIVLLTGLAVTVVAGITALTATRKGRTSWPRRARLSHCVTSGGVPSRYSPNSGTIPSAGGSSRSARPRTRRPDGSCRTPVSRGPH